MFKKYYSGKNLPFWLFTFGVLILLTVPTLIQDGMFLDAMLYTCVSHNLSHGFGTFWFPQFSHSNFSGFPFFLEHPPLVFGIQSLFFRLFGDSMYVERFYTFLTTCTTAFLINLLWRDLFKKEEEIKELGWLPILFWITIPASIWSYSNNMMENSMAIFDLCAVILILRASESERTEAGRFFLAGLFVFLATFSKGIPGFFPVAIPFLHWLIFRKKPIGNIILSTAILLSGPVIIYLIMFHFPQSKESLQFYVTKRLWVRINDSPVVTNRFYILKNLFTELIPQLLFLAIIITAAKIKKVKVPIISNPARFALFISIGLAASVPLTFTFVQRGFYLVPSLSFFGIGLSVLIAPRISDFRIRLINKKEVFRIFSILSIVLFFFSIGFSYMQKGKTQRDREMLHDVHAIGNTIPGKSAITVNQDIANTSVLECYFIRYYDISLYIDEPKEYLMVKKSMHPVINSDFEKLNIDTKIYDVYMRKENR
jgi:4-amino-4-deoxy-L-arabinose transferase-like glycosyltransferase